MEDVGSDMEDEVRQQIEDDYLLAVDMQNKLDTGVDMVEHKEAVRNKIIDNNNLNTETNKSFYQKSKSDIETPSILPGVPKNAVYAKDLENQNKSGVHVTKSDQDVSARTNTSAAENKKPVPAKVAADVVKSAGDGTGLNKTQDEKDGHFNSLAEAQ